MITTVSHPPDLSKWDQAGDPFYLELYGESEPTLDMTYAEVIPPGGAEAKTVQSTPIYEYWWTLGHGGTAPHHRHLFEHRGKDDLWGTLDDIAARVYVYFPISGGWRIKELVAVRIEEPRADARCRLGASEGDVREARRAAHREPRPQLHS